MSLCLDCQAALPLTLCGEEGAIVYVGTTADPVTHVRLRNLATGRVTQYDATQVGGEVTFEPDGLVIEGHVYEVTLWAGDIQVDYAPYVVTGYLPTPAADDYRCVLVVWEYVEGYEVGDQHLILA